MTQNAACEPHGKPASFQGLSLFFGGSLSGLDRSSRKDKKREKREGGSIPTMMLFCNFNFTVKKCFPGSDVDEEEKSAEKLTGKFC